MKSSLSLFRPLNLTILALIMFVIRYRLLDVLDYKMVTNGHDSFQFVFYILGSVCIAAAGYFHNNYLDQEVDRINEKQVSFNFSKKSTQIILFVLNLLGVLFLFLFKSSAVVLFGAVPIILLLTYNVYLKKLALIGNALVAFLASYQLIGLIICDLWIGDDIFWQNSIFLYVLFLFGASFLIMLSREIIKDIEDQEGDKKMKYRTLAIMGGVKVSKIFSGILILLTFINFVSFIAQNDIGSWIAYFISFLLLTSLLVSLFSLVKSKEKEDFKEVSTLLKGAIGIAAVLLIFIP